MRYLLLAALLALTACSGADEARSVPQGFVESTHDRYRVAYPAEWESQDDEVLKAVEPVAEGEVPMGVHVVLDQQTADASEAAIRGELLIRELQQKADVEVLEQGATEVAGAETAHRSELAGTVTTADGEEVRILQINITAADGEGGFVILQISGPEDGFDRDTADQIVDSLALP